MPDSWGHAKDFYDHTLSDGEFNAARGLLQFKNGGQSKPQPEDLIIFGPSENNSYGHVAIISKTSINEIEIAQQNSGPNGKARVNLKLSKDTNNWKIPHPRVLGWLRMP